MEYVFPHRQKKKKPYEMKAEFDTLNFISLTVQSSQYKQSKSKLPLPLQANYRRADLILEFFKSSLTEMLGKHNIGNHKSVHDDLPIY
jgi:hypothetical protein